MTVGPSTASTTSSSMAASSARAPGKKRVTPPKPWSIVFARDGRSASGRRVAGGAIEAFAVGAAARDRPHRVAQVLLHERDLGLHGDRDVGQRLASVAVGRDAGQHPRRALLHHQAARAVDRVDDDDDLDVLLARAGGQHAAPVRAQPLGHQQARPLAATASSKRASSTASDRRSTANTRVARVVAHHRRQLVDRLALARGDHLVANRLVHARECGRPAPRDRAAPVMPACSGGAAARAAPRPSLRVTCRTRSCRRRSRARPGT